MKIAITFIFFALTHSLMQCQAQLIQWNRNVRIKWSDFEGKADRKSPFAAMSAVGIHYKYSSLAVGDVVKIKFEINSKFDKTKSWSRKQLRTADVLRHEQLHFDISELVARQFRKEAESSSYSKHYKIEIAAVFNRYTAYLERLQKKYDIQTEHSKNKLRQKEWENIIHRELMRS